MRTRSGGTLGLGGQTDLVKLRSTRDARSGQSGDLWQISYSFLKHSVDCTLVPSDLSLSGGASLRLEPSDRRVRTISSAWISPATDGRRRAVVVCLLRDKSSPAIMHLIVP